MMWKRTNNAEKIAILCLIVTVFLFVVTMLGFVPTCGIGSNLALNANHLIEILAIVFLVYLLSKQHEEEKSIDTSVNILIDTLYDNTQKSFFFISTYNHSSQAAALNTMDLTLLFEFSKLIQTTIQNSSDDHLKDLSNNIVDKYQNILTVNGNQNGTLLCAHTEAIALLINLKIYICKNGTSFN